MVIYFYIFLGFGLFVLVWCLVLWCRVWWGLEKVVLQNTMNTTCTMTHDKSIDINWLLYVSLLITQPTQWSSVLIDDSHNSDTYYSMFLVYNQKWTPIQTLYWPPIAGFLFYQERFVPSPPQTPTTHSSTTEPSQPKNKI